MISRIQLPDYKPDQSNNSGVLLTAKNVYKALDGYRSVGGVEELSDSLVADFQGGTSAIDADENGYLYAGTGAGLYELSSVAGTWTELLSGLTVSGRWKFQQFGDFVVAVTGGTTYEIDIVAQTASALSGAPTATTIAKVKDHLVLGRAGGEASKVQWSGTLDQTDWTDGTNNGGSVVFQDGGAVQAVVGGEYGIVLQRLAIQRMTFTGDSTAPFQFDEISANFGCAAANTVAQAGRLIFFRSDRGFVVLEDGTNIRRIGSEKVDRAFNEMVSRDSLKNIYTAVDPENNLVMWLVPGSPGSMWTYNFELDAWTVIEFDAKGLFSGFTTSISLDDFPSIGITNLDTATISLDDPRWSGGNPRLYLVTNTNKAGTLTGPNLKATLELGNSELTPGRQARVRGVRPIWEGTSGISLSLNGKARLGDTGTTRTATTYRSTGMMPVRVKGRHISTTVTIDAGTDWDYIQSLEFKYELGGEK